MTRQELKQLWFNLPTSDVVTRTIKLEMDTCKDRKNQGTVQITSDGPDGFRQFTTHQKFPMTYILESKEYLSGDYKLIIKLVNGVIV